jgi:tagatose 6-phosphate kinase
VIAVVALNPALDVTHHVACVDWSGVNRPAAVRAVPGGKGPNVARTLHALGADVLLMGVAGGTTGGAVRAGLLAAGVPAVFTDIAADTRRTFVVVDTARGEVASFYEPGPPVTEAEYDRFLVTFADALPRCAAVVLSGSLPAGLPPDTYAGLIATAAAAGVPAILDTAGPALLAGAAAGPAVVKPNVAELGMVADRELHWGDPAGQAAVLAAAARLRAAGAAAVVVSAGADGLIAVTADGSWHAVPRPVDGNPTGAGDAVVAGLAHGLTQGWPWPQRLRHAAALGSATATAPVAGEFRTEDYRLALAGLELRELEQV